MCMNNAFDALVLLSDGMLVVISKTVAYGLDSVPVLSAQPQNPCSCSCSRLQMQTYTQLCTSYAQAEHPWPFLLSLYLHCPRC
jgi:hypothetical protein